MNTEIKLAVSELKEALPGLTKAIGRSRTLPVLQTVRINRNQEGVVTLHATDLDSFVTYTAKTTQPGSPAHVLVPVDQLAKAAKCSSPKEEIGIVPEAKGKVKIRYNIAGNLVEQTISTCAMDEFPAAPEVRQERVQLEPKFGKALKEALECSSEDSSRYVLQGACLDVDDQKFHYIVGTNGRMLFSANSFCFALEKSVIIPDSKFLNWSDFLDEQPAYISVEPGKESKEAKNGQPAQEEEAGWVKLESPRWSYIAREIHGKYPNWKQCVPSTSSKWTKVILSEEALKQLIQVIPNLPGADTTNSTIRLRVDGNLTVEGQNKDDGKWTSVPVQSVNITGQPVTIALNREYLLRGLRFGLNQLEIEDSLTPLVLSNTGKKMVIMPVRIEEPAPEKTNAAQEPQATEESKTMTTTTTSPLPEVARVETPAVESQTNRINSNGHMNGSGNGSVIKSLVDQVEQIKENLKQAIRDLSTVIDTVKQAEKEKRTTEKEIEVVRAKLRQIQNVSI